MAGGAVTLGCPRNNSQLHTQLTRVSCSAADSSVITFLPHSCRKQMSGGEVPLNPPHIHDVGKFLQDTGHGVAIGANLPLSAL